jgi:hypothetical protein
VRSRGSADETKEEMRKMTEMTIKPETVEQARKLVEALGLPKGMSMDMARVLEAKLLLKEAAKPVATFNPFNPTENFYGCDEETRKYESPVVYVPSLVYMLHRLGGPQCIEEMEEYGGGKSVVYDGVGCKVAEVQRVSRDGEPVQFFVEEWHIGGNGYGSEKLLSVHFSLPEKWHLGEWTADFAMDCDTFSPDAETTRQIALLCDRTIGRGMVQNY